MFCENCGNALIETDKFCQKCGFEVAHKEAEKDNFVETEKPPEASGIKGSITNENLIRCAEHLEFLGYKVEKIKAKDKTEKDIIVATHSQKTNVVIIGMNPNVVLLKISFTTNKKHVAEMDSFINEANRLLVYSKVYCDSEKDNPNVILRLETIYTAEYRREAFGDLFDAFNNEAGNLLGKINHFNELFLD